MNRKPRLFLDSNVLTGGIVGGWGLDKEANGAVLSLCAVRDEVEENLLLHAGARPPEDADTLLEDTGG